MKRKHEKDILKVEKNRRMVSVETSNVTKYKSTVEKKV